ncbi:sulfatase-like hydrolase/transferase [Profundicola chukchiensis]|uniref:sulfatase-like hydrolase/transferase n=1 Tax=Profundicola chukchiensis TaxID=2961959 RepID=UPI0034E22F1F
MLVIGETVRYANFQINGYERNTTLNLSYAKNILSFSNTYSIKLLPPIPFLQFLPVQLLKI